MSRDIKYTIDWEDPRIELGAINEIRLMHKNSGPSDKQDSDYRPDVLVIGGAGDTALTLVTDKVEQVTCVDGSEGQLALIELKATLLRFVSDPEIRIDFLEGNMDDEDIEDIYYCLRDDLKSRRYWDRRRYWLKSGILGRDVWRKLYFELGNKESVYDKVFSYRRLLELFGERFFYFRIELRPSLYFCERVKKLCESDSSQWRDQIVNGLTFDCSECHYPEYLEHQSCVFETKSKIRYIHSEIRMYLAETKKRFDLISLSNIMDGWAPPQIKAFIQLLSLKIRFHGRLVLRRMLGDIPLYPIVNEYFMVLKIDRPFLEDRTCLYQEVILATPRGITKRELNT